MRIVVAVAAVSIAPTAFALKVGAFDSSRGGEFALGSAAQVSTIRNTIQTNIPSIEFVSAPLLTPTFLSGIDVLMVCSTRAGSAAISPLTAAEQTALKDFVHAGGRAILFADNDSFAGSASDPANESLVDAFGIDVKGTVSVAANVTLLGAGNPISGGPFGVVTSASFYYTGGLNVVPAPFQSVGTVVALGTPGLVYAPYGSLGSGSGTVIVFSDASILYNGFSGGPSDTLVLNSLAYAAVPEPASFAAMAVGAIALLRRRHR